MVIPPVLGHNTFHPNSLLHWHCGLSHCWSVGIGDGSMNDQEAQTSNNEGSPCCRLAPQSLALSLSGFLFLSFSLSFFLFPHIIVWGSYFWGCSRRPTTDDRPTDDRRPTDRPPPLSFFYTHTRHTHVDSQTHTRSLTVFYTHTRHTHVDSLTLDRRTHVR